jgi:serine/threonine protein phosphatase PrpC
MPPPLLVFLQVLKEAVQQAEVEILASYEAGRGSDTAGSTLCAILLVDDKLHVAHVGDSRAVLGRGAEPIQLTRDHKPGCQIEAARIEQDDPHADISGDGYMYGELAVARAIGSAAWKRDPSKRALIPTPDLVSIQLQPDDDFVVLATDGLWDKVDNTQVRVGCWDLCWGVLRGWVAFVWWALGASWSWQL